MTPRRAAILLAVLDDTSKPISVHARELHCDARNINDWLRAEGIDPRRWPRKTRDGVSTLTEIPWDEDPVCLDIIERFPDGAPLEVIGEAYGLTREAVRQIEEAARKKVQRGVISSPGWWMS